MKAFKTMTGLVAPLDRSNVDTDAIIPKQFLKSIHRTGFGPHLFDEWRYLDHGEPGQDCSLRPINTGFVLNDPRYQGASILLTRENFGCGSSREHAPWAILDDGFQVIIAESFADIFYSNCFKNGILPIRLRGDQVDDLFQSIEKESAFSLTINLESQTITSSSGSVIPFKLDEYRRYSLINGLDEIGKTLSYRKEISAFEKKHRSAKPWLFREVQ